MIDVWKATGENRKEVVALLQSYKEKHGENNSGYLFDFSEDNQPWVLVDTCGDGRLTDVKCTSVNYLDAPFDQIEVYVESDDDSGRVYDMWYKLNEACGLTENCVYQAIIDELNKLNNE